MKAGKFPVAVPESLELVAVHFYIARQVIERASKKAAPFERAILKALRRAKGRRIVLPGIEIRLVKRTTIRWKPTGNPEWPDPRKADEELRWTWMQYRYWQSQIESRTEVADAMQARLIEEMSRYNRLRMRFGGIEVWRVKKNTVRANVVGGTDFGGYLKPFPDEDVD